MDEHALIVRLGGIILGKTGDRRVGKDYQWTIRLTKFSNSPPIQAKLRYAGSQNQSDPEIGSIRRFDGGCGTLRQCQRGDASGFTFAGERRSGSMSR